MCVSEISAPAGISLCFVQISYSRLGKIRVKVGRIGFQTRDDWRDMKRTRMEKHESFTRNSDSQLLLSCAHEHANSVSVGFPT